MIELQVPMMLNGKQDSMLIMPLKNPKYVVTEYDIHTIKFDNNITLRLSNKKLLLTFLNDLYNIFNWRDNIEYQYKYFHSLIDNGYKPTVYAEWDFEHSQKGFENKVMTRCTTNSCHFQIKEKAIPMFSTIIIETSFFMYQDGIRLVWEKDEDFITFYDEIMGLFENVQSI